MMNRTQKKFALMLAGVGMSFIATPAQAAESVTPNQRNEVGLGLNFGIKYMGAELYYCPMAGLRTSLGAFQPTAKSDMGMKATRVKLGLGYQMPVQDIWTMGGELKGFIGKTADKKWAADVEIAVTNTFAAHQYFNLGFDAGVLLSAMPKFEMQLPNKDIFIPYMTLRLEVPFMRG